MSLVLTAFTGRGVTLALRIASQMEDTSVWTMKKHAVPGCQVYEHLSSWTEEMFRAGNDILFVSATGIAVRTIAPFLQDKMTDPAILAVDEYGRYVIPLVSGHVGGANALARKVARILHAQAVVSTATDLNGLFAVDEWAARNGMTIGNRSVAKRISAHLLAGRGVYARCDLPHEPYPEGITEGEPSDLFLTYRDISSTEEQLVLHPPVLAVGVGCRKNLPTHCVTEAVEQVFREYGLSMESIFCLASVDLKAEDEGIHRLAKRHDIPCYFYTAEQLRAVEGAFTPSEFVRSVAGVDNVCERSAVLASGGTLLVRKTALSGVTVAVALRNDTIHFVREEGEK